LLRWFLDDIPEQRIRVEELLSSGTPLTIDDVVVIEAIYALESGAKLPRSTIRTYFKVCMTHSVDLNRALWTKVLDVWVAHPKLSVVDIYLATKAGLAGEWRALE